MPVPKSEKPKLVTELAENINSHTTVGVLDMKKMKAGQFFKIKNAISKDTQFKMLRKALIIRAFKEAGKPELEKLLEHIDGSPAIILSNLDSFKLFALLKKNRAKSSAKPGDIVPEDLTIPKGSTQIPPGPAISALQKVKLKTKIEGGKIAVVEDKVVAKAGEEVTEDVAVVLGMLKIQPIEVGMKLAATYEDGMIYSREVLDVSQEEYIQNMEGAIQAAMNLSMNIGFPTKENAMLLIQKSFMEAKSLSMEANIIDETIIGDLLAKATREAAELEKLVPEAPKEEAKEEEKKEEAPAEEKKETSEESEQGKPEATEASAPSASGENKSE